MRRRLLMSSNGKSLEVKRKSQLGLTRIAKNMTNTVSLKKTYDKFSIELYLNLKETLTNRSEFLYLSNTYLKMFTSVSGIVFEDGGFQS